MSMAEYKKTKERAGTGKNSVITISRKDISKLVEEISNRSWQRAKLYHEKEHERIVDKLAIAFCKYVYGCHTEEEGWNEFDKEAMDLAMSEKYSVYVKKQLKDNEKRYTTDAVTALEKLDLSSKENIINLLFNVQGGRISCRLAATKIMEKLPPDVHFQPGESFYNCMQMGSIKKLTVASILITKDKSGYTACYRVTDSGGNSYNFEKDLNDQYWFLGGWNMFRTVKQAKMYGIAQRKLNKLIIASGETDNGYVLEMADDYRKKWAADMITRGML